jgi:single-strand DNA-binding protein
MNVNKVILIGRLTRDPEIRSTPSGQTIARIGIATSRAWTDKNGQKQDQVEYHNLTLWGRLGEIAGQYLIKGQECYFEGRLQTRSYTGKDNVERKTTEIVVETMQMGSKPQGGGYSDNKNYPSKPTSPNNASSFQNQNKAPHQNDRPTKEEDLPTINLDDEREDVRIEDVPF